MTLRGLNWKNQIVIIYVNGEAYVRAQLASFKKSEKAKSRYAKLNRKVAS